MTDTKSQLLNELIYASIMIFISVIVSKIISSTIWPLNQIHVHTVLELISIFTLLAIFIIIWFLFERNSNPAFRTIGFGYLIVIIFLFFHLLKYPGYASGLSDLSLKYALLARLTEAIVLFKASTWQHNFTNNKIINLFISLLIAFGASYLLLISDNLPVLYNLGGVTQLNQFANLVIIALLVVSLLLNMHKIHEKDFICYRYLCLSILIALFANLSFLMQTQPTSYYHVLGHLLRICYYYYLFKGIFVSAIAYPYEKLEHSNKVLDEIFNNLPVALTTYDRNLKLSFANKKAEEITGYKKEDVLGLTAQQIAEVFYEGQNYLGDLAKQSKPFTHEVRTVKTKVNNYIKISIDTYKLQDSSFLCLFNEAKQIQDMDNLQLQTKTILNSISNFILFVDTDKKIKMCNRALEELLEMPEADIIGADLDKLNDIISFSDKQLVEKFINRKIENSTYEASLITPQGTKKYLLLQHAFVKNVDEELIGVVAVGSDITELKQQQSSKIQHEKMALLGQMAAGVVHEVKNPLTAILGFSQLISKKTEKEDVKEYAAVIVEEVNNLNKVVSDSWPLPNRVPLY